MLTRKDIASLRRRVEHPRQTDTTLEHREFERMLAVLEKLPTNAQGNLVLPGSTQYVATPQGPESVLVEAIRVVSTEEPTTTKAHSWVIVAYEANYDGAYCRDLYSDESAARHAGYPKP